MYRLRFILTIAKSFLTRSHLLMDDFDLYFWVIPLIDTDFSRMFTQTYGLYMGLGRWHYVFNSEFRSVALRKAWVPVTSAETIVYKKSVRAFSRVKLRTKLICWDERRFYLEQSFYVKDQLYAQGILEGIVRSPKGPLKPVDVFPAIGIKQDSPPFPESIKLWIASRAQS